MSHFWIADGEFSGQAAEDLQALWDDMHDRDWDYACEAEPPLDPDELCLGGCGQSPYDCQCEVPPSDG